MRRLALTASPVLVIMSMAATNILYLATGGESNDLGFTIAMLLGFPSFAAVGALILSRQPGHRMGRLFLAVGVLGGSAPLAEAYAAYVWTRTGVVTDWVVFGAWVHGMHWFIWMSMIVVFIPLLYPNGRFLSAGWRRFALVLAGVIAVFEVVVIGLGPTLNLSNVPDAEFRNPIGLDLGGIEGLLWVAFLFAGGAGVVGAVMSVVQRYRHSRGDERLQMKWFAFAVGSFPVSILLSTMVLHNGAVFSVSMILLPIALGVAVLKYRLYDIDVVISKTVVFAGLAAFITAIYVGIVVGVGSLLGAGGEPNLGLSIVATAVVAVAFQPVRERLTRLANRLVFGRRATPYEVLSRFSEHLGEMAAPEQTLQRMAKLLADGTGAARAQVWLHIGGELRPAATWPAHMTDRADPDHRVEVTHEGDLLGALSLDKQRGESLTPTDQKLVDDLAAQAGLVLRNLKLTEELKARIVDLQASRQRLVAAQDQERRRLERDLHDGAQRQLLELRSRLTAASSTATRERADKAAQILQQVTVDADDADATLRELAHGIYPPLLAAEGLAGALTAQAAKAAVPVVVEPDGIGRYPQDVEAAVYFCVLEAVNNAAKYANPTQVTIRLAEHHGHLTFQVTDDGDGFDPTTTPKGHGTTNMTDRLDALNGHLEIASSPAAGTRVAGVVPIQPSQEVLI